MALRERGRSAACLLACAPARAHARPPAHRLTHRSLLSSGPRLAAGPVRQCLLGEMDLEVHLTSTTGHGGCLLRLVRLQRIARLGEAELVAARCVVGRDMRDGAGQIVRYVKNAHGCGCVSVASAQAPILAAFRKHETFVF